MKYSYIILCGLLLLNYSGNGQVLEDRIICELAIKDSINKGLLDGLRPIHFLETTRFIPFEENLLDSALIDDP